MLFRSVAAAVGVGVFLNIRGVEHGERLSKIEGKLEGIAKNLDRLLDRQAKNAFTVPGQSPEDIEAAVARLRVRNITVNFDDIHRASAVLVKNPDQRSCGVLMQLAAYRSVVNSTITEARQNIVQTIGPGGSRQVVSRKARRMDSDRGSNTNIGRQGSIRAASPQ